MAITSDNLKSRRGMVGGAVTALLVAGGVAAVVLPNQGGSNTASGNGENAPMMLAQMGDPGAGDPSMPSMGGAGMPGMPGAAPGGSAVPTGGTPEKFPNSFSKAPASYGGGGAAGGMGMGGPMGGMDPMGMGGMGAAPATGGVTADFSKLKPIQRNKTAAGYRKDPFDSYRIPKYKDPDAYTLIVPLRVADRPVPPPPPPNPNPEIQFGPLPPVPRRVAGILYNGSVSAILETGTPGSPTDVDVVQPGSTVPSGIPGVEDLTVVSISPTSVILRANDGRTVSVPLSNVPAAYQDSFRNQNLPGQGQGGGMMGPGGPGMMGPGGPGMPPGGPGMMGPGGRGGNRGDF
jgi:hypothetical protein